MPDLKSNQKSATKYGRMNRQTEKLVHILVLSYNHLTVHNSATFSTIIEKNAQFCCYSRLYTINHNMFHLLPTPQNTFPLTVCRDQLQGPC